MDKGALLLFAPYPPCRGYRATTDYRAGKDKLFGFFVGAAMKASGGKMNPGVLNEMLKKKLAG